MKGILLHKWILVWLLVMASAVAGIAQDTIGIMAYNLYRYPSATPVQREFLLAQILAEAKPDLLLVSELESESGADLILNHAFGYSPDTFSRGSFFFNQSDVTDTLQQMLYFNTRKFTLLDERIYPTTIRDINRYTLLLNTTDVTQDSIIFEVFVAHLKSSTGSANVNARLGMVDTFVQVLASIPTDRHVLFGGDMNFYRTSELGYQHVIDTNRAHVMIDPMGVMTGTWQDNIAFAHMHTQSTRTSSAGFGLYGARGGVDDRFDFIFMSKHLQDGTDTSLWYLPQSYVAFGNNGNCLNMAINDTACAGNYSQALRQMLHDMSDHLPVAMRLVTSKTLLPYTPQDTTSVAAPEYDNQFYWGIMGSNTVQSVLYLDWKFATTSNLTAPNYFVVYNTMGQEMYREPIARTQGVTAIDVSNWASGVYFVRNSTGGYLKFVKY